MDCCVQVTSKMKFDDLLREVGEFGPYQKWVYFVTCLPNINVGAFMLLNVIVFDVPEHRLVL